MSLLNIKFILIILIYIISKFIIYTNIIHLMGGMKHNSQELYVNVIYYG